MINFWSSIVPSRPDDVLKLDERWPFVFYKERYANTTQTIGSMAWFNSVLYGRI
jgi:hypothetical protein